MVVTALKPERWLVMSGGASHGADLWGALKLVRQRYRIKGVAAVSISACFAAGECLGMDPNKLEVELMALFQGNILTGGKPPLSKNPRILWAGGGGLNDWTHIVKHLKRIFGDKTTMRSCVKPLVVVVGDVYTRRPVYVDSRKSPDVLIWEVLACSTAVWPVADAQTMPSFGRGNRKYVDGGWADNAPVSVFSTEPEPTVTMYLAAPDWDRDGEPDPKRTGGVLGVLEAALEMSLYSSPVVKARVKDELIPIYTTGSGFDFNLSAEEIQRRIYNGARWAGQAFRNLNQ